MDQQDAARELAIVRKWLEIFSTRGLGPQRLAAIHLLGGLPAIERELARMLDGKPASGRDNGNVG